MRLREVTFRDSVKVASGAQELRIVATEGRVDLSFEAGLVTVTQYVKRIEDGVTIGVSELVLVPVNNVRHMSPAPVAAKK